MFECYFSDERCVYALLCKLEKLLVKSDADGRLIQCFL